MKIRPLFDWIIIERVRPADRTAGGIVIPESAREDSAEGIVIKAGPGRFKKKKGKGKAQFDATALKAGQRVFFNEYMTKEVEIDGREITFIREEDVLGTIEEKTEIAVKGNFPVEPKKESKVLVRKKNELVPKAAPSGAQGERDLKKKSEADDGLSASAAKKPAKDKKSRKSRRKSPGKK